jgi:zinc transporter 9
VAGLNITANPTVSRQLTIIDAHIDNDHTVLVAEIELREEAVVAALFPVMAAYEEEFLSMLPAARRNDSDVMRYSRTRAAAQATLERAEIVVEKLVADIKARLPRVHHVTIEVEGIATAPLQKGAVPV